MTESLPAVTGAACGWMQIEQYLKRDDRAVLPLGIPVFPVALHAQRMENFPITRWSGIAQPTHQRALVDYSNMTSLTPRPTRDLVGDVNVGGYYRKPGEVMDTRWQVAVEETPALMQWPVAQKPASAEKRSGSKIGV